MRHTSIALILLAVSSPVFAGEAESSAFTLDLRCEPSGEIFPGEEGTEVSGLSSRWTAATTTWATDSNNDGVPDWWEQNFGVAVGGLPANGDADCDGYSNLVEYNAGMNPLVPDVLAAMSAGSIAYLLDTGGRSASSGSPYGLDEVWGISGMFPANTAGWSADSDKDGIPDWWELLYGLNPNWDDSQLDSDGDGRTNLAEYNAGTNPMAADAWTRGISVSDNLFTTDTRVWNVGVNPSFDETFAVIRVSGGFICDTGGLYYDWDGDGIPNWWEARYSRDGGKTGLDGGLDDDGDGMSNYDEFIAYTNPTNSNSKFFIEILPVLPVAISLAPYGRQPSNVLNYANCRYALRWQSAKGRTYSVYSTDDLKAGWNSEADAEISGTGDVIEFCLTQIGSRMFFKVVVRISDDY